MDNLKLEESVDMLSTVLNSDKSGDNQNDDILLNNFSEEVKQAIISQENRFNDKKILEEKAEKALKLVRDSSGNSNQEVSYGYFTESNPSKVNITGNRNKYMIVPDLHIWYKDISCRKDYLGEIEECLNNIMMYIISDESINNIILAGDIYHRGFNDLDSSRPIKRYWSELKHVLNNRSGELYAVIGNHEFSFSKNNPFWLQDDVLFKTPEDIMDNGVHIYLESYHCKKSIREFRSNVEADICITHNEVLPPDMADFIRNESGRRIFISKRCTNFNRYNVKSLFVGHMHQIADTFIVNDDNRNFEVQYLGSIGRTSVEEVSNDFRSRSLPVIEIGIDENGYEGECKFRVTQLPLELREYHETVISEQVEKNRQIRTFQKGIKELKLQKVTDDPVEDFKKEFNNPQICDIVDCAYENRKTIDLINLISDINALLD